MKKDAHLLTRLLSFTKLADPTLSERLKFTVGLECKEFKPNYILIDESDAIIFKDPLAFYKHVRKAKAHVCGFTAKDFWGSDLVTENDMLKKMHFVSVDTTVVGIKNPMKVDHQI